MEALIGRISLAASALATIAGCATTQAVQTQAVKAQAVQTMPAAAAADTPSRPANMNISAIGTGYLPRGTGPDSLLLNPLPPAPGSAALARDEEVQARAVALHGTPRWELATRDASLSAETAPGGFNCAAGIRISRETTPKTVALMVRAAGDLAFSTSATKRKYMRARPFTVNARPMCTPEADAVLRSDGSYPSGHSAIGYGWGLILAELVPSRAAQLVARGRAFGDSRVVCNVHWLSDVEEGRVAASATIARLHAEPEFRADADAARAELAGMMPNPDMPSCAAEAAALSLTPLSPRAGN